MTVARTASRSISPRARKCSSAGNTCAGSSPSRAQCSVAAARTSSLCMRGAACASAGATVSGKQACR
eukprot:10268230-Alexandrium_andersonii.AAC.1